MALTVADIMNRKLLYIRAGDRRSLARGKILEFGVTAVPVLDEEHKPVGIVSLRDLARSDEHPFQDGPVRVVRDSASIDEGARAISQYGMHHLVVVDREGVAVGMVSAIDFVRALVGLPVAHPQAFDRY
jgi:CBS-domain-containing membrane protein